MAHLSRRAHKAAARGRAAELEEVEADIDQAAATGPSRSSSSSSPKNLPRPLPGKEGRRRAYAVNPGYVGVVALGDHLRFPLGSSETLYPKAP